MNKKYESHIGNPPHLLEETDPKKLTDWKNTMDSEVKILGKIPQCHKCMKVCHKYGNEDQCWFQFPHGIEPESYFDANTNSVILKCIDSMVNYFNKHIKYTVCKLWVQYLEWFQAFVNNNIIISKTLITLHTLCTCSSMSLQVAFRLARLATSATCWTLAIAARSCKLILNFPDEIGVAAKYRSGYETGSSIMNCQSPIKVTM